MLHQEERLEAVQTAVQTLTNNFDNLPEPLNYIKNETAIGSIIEGKITGDEANRASQYAHAEGEYTLALGSASHSEGRYATYTDLNTSQLVTQPTTAYSLASHAEGEGTIASGNAAHSEGKLTQASGATAHAEGHKTIAYGNSSHAEGQGTYAKHWAQHVFGLYNAQDPSTEQPHRRGNYIEIVGNGQNNDNRSNARTLDWSGNETLKGSLTLGKGTADEVTITATQLKQLLTLLS